MGKVTIKDIARESNVSIGTVYRAVNNTGRISDETRLKVLDTVNRMGYKANTVARGLAMHSKFNFLVIMPSIPESFWGDVKKGVKRAITELSEYGVQIIEFYHDNEGKCNNRNVMDILSTTNIDAIAMCIVNFDDCGRVLLFAKEKDIPVAIFNDDLVSRDRLFFYGPDNLRAGKMAAELMSKFSRQDGTCCIISTTSISSINPGGIKREDGFKDYLIQCCPNMHFIGTFRCSNGETPLVIHKIVRDYPDITGFYFTDYTQLSKNLMVFSDQDKRYIVIGHEYQYLITGEKPRDYYYSNVNIIIGANADCLEYSNNGCGFE